MNRTGYYANVYEPDNAGVNGTAIFTKTQGEGELIPVLVWNWSDFAMDPVLRMPMASFTFNSGGRNIKILAIHIPPPFYFNDKERAEVADLAVAELDENTIVAGDFNMFDFDPLLDKFLAQGLSDSAANSGNLDATWSGLARIDYILIPDDFEAAYSGTISVPGSDHRAVISGIFF